MRLFSRSERGRMMEGMAWGTRVVFSMWRIKGWMEGWEERKGEMRERLFAVVRRVMVRLGLVARLWFRSKRGIMWPCAGNGITSMCDCAVALPLRPAMLGCCVCLKLYSD
ncbi:hypothetical protein VNO78_02733 [Psophocarpus tetragonolobus]|uniref:Uncharacterized protein n=1 Tax=Psophocarpus tetragonolobus TaxID=3891 RepID=A0AAN9XUZ1_PSOTE